MHATRAPAARRGAVPPADRRRGRRHVARRGPLLQPRRPRQPARRARAPCSSSRRAGCTSASAPSKDCCHCRPAAGWKSRSPPLETEAVLMPDWEVLVLLRPAPHTTLGERDVRVRPRASSPRARSGDCRRPGVTRTSASCPCRRAGRGSSARRGSWSGRLVYESAVVTGGDVLVFAKGVNPRQGVNRAASDIRCVYYRRAGPGGDDGVVATLPAASSAQQVFRCPPPPSSAASHELRVTLAVAGKTPPSLAVYTRRALDRHRRRRRRKADLRLHHGARRGQVPAGWVVYHAAVGVDRFYLYDNGSEDDLEDQVHRLNSAGYNISTVTWPWAKAQEAGFSHSAGVLRDSCEWMAFVGVDEFIFSPTWNQSRPDGIHAPVDRVGSQTGRGRVSLRCADFGPSGGPRTKEGSPKATVRGRRERHKSLLRLDAVDDSLLNSIHHFTLRPGFRVEWSKRVRVNHYKYQAWEEFKVKFRRRVSTYVADWTDPVNIQSKDRTPGLGFEAVEPVGWTHKFCEVNDTLLHDATRRWFGVGFGNNLNLTQAHHRS
ncbi:hypothetical protein ZWY2020_051257 [Hordeum vulgare]|nr:hypothetical protein ZWY2020_051257 [Hordeum vulgare]